MALPPTQKARKARVFDEAKALRFVEACRREQRDLLFVFVLLTGLRPSEFFGLEYPKLQVEMENGVERGCAVIDRTVCRRKGGGWYFSTPKTLSSVRPVYFPAVMYYELAANREAHLDRRRRLGHRHELVFTGECGEPLFRSTLSRRLRKVCALTGIDPRGRSLYTLRRSHATLSLLAGENLKSLSDRMGHSSVEFTQDEYVDALPAMQHRAADRLEKMILRTTLAQGEGMHLM